MPGPVILPAALDPLVPALRSLLARGMPPVAVIGGIGVNVQLSTTDEPHRATQDLDVVVDDDVSTAVEVLAQGNELVRENTVVVAGIEIDVIPTESITEDDLVDLDDGPRLFVAGHRWALETAEPVQIIASGETVILEIPVASPAGLVATKSHAVGYARSGRRATKHGGDLYDLFRLVEAFDAQGALRLALGDAPGGIGRTIAEVVATEILAQPARAMRQMSPAASRPLDVERIVDAMEPFASDLTA